MIARTLSTGLLGAACVLASSSALAAPTEGEKLFREGRTALQANDLETACARFAESQKKEPGPGTALNLGECEERRGHLIVARDAFALAASGYTAAGSKGYATGRSEALEKRIPKVTLKVTGVRSPVVKIGDRVVELGTEQRMDPGEVVFTIEAPTFKPKRMPIVLKENNTPVEVELGPLESESAVAKPEPKKDPGRVAKNEGGSDAMRTVGFVALGVGAASLVVGGVTGVVTLGKASTVKDHCDGDLACDSEGTRAAKSGKTFSLVSTITVIAGVVGVGAGAVLVLTSPPKKTGMTTIGPGPGDVGLMMKRSF